MEETYELSLKGRMFAQTAIMLYMTGKSHEEIADILGLEGTDEEKKIMVQMLVLIMEAE